MQKKYTVCLHWCTIVAKPHATAMMLVRRRCSCTYSRCAWMGFSATISDA